MKKIYLILLAFLVGTPLVYASLLCTGDPTPNLATTLNLNCSTTISNSVCYAKTYQANGVLIEQYPKNCFGEDRLCINTFSDGSFVVPIFINDKGDKQYNEKMNYTAEVICFNPSDNSTNSTVFLFTPATYPPPTFMLSFVNWLTVEDVILIAGGILILLCVLIAVGLYFYHSING